MVGGNVKRVLARLLLIDKPVNNSKNHSTFSAAANLLLARRKPHLFNQAMMELDAHICRLENPACEKCPLKQFCKAYTEKQIENFPKKVKTAKAPTYHIAAGVIFKKDRFLITRRKPEGLLGGLWEFPGRKVQKGETSEETCKREIMEEVNLRVKIIEHLTTVKHAYTHFRSIMDVFVCNHIKGRIRLNGPDDFRWINLKQTKNYPFPKATLKVLPFF